MFGNELIMETGCRSRRNANLSTDDRGKEVDKVVGAKKDDPYKKMRSIYSDIH